MKVRSLKYKNNLLKTSVFLCILFIIYTAYSIGRIMHARDNVKNAWHSLQDSHLHTLIVFNKITTDSNIQIPKEYILMDMDKIKNNWFGENASLPFYDENANAYFSQILGIENNLEGILRYIQDSKQDSVRTQTLIETRLFANRQDHLAYIDSAMNYRNTLDRELVFMPQALKKFIFMEPQMIGIVSNRK